MKTVYLDTETTGLHESDEIVELTIIDDNEEILIDTLLKPINHTKWPKAQNVLSLIHISEPTRPY